ncbi:hypothetical protein NQ176_g1473 [Zarea fungicola]|uniref:Uncharacterized protein n=1 Tax=Zarea fungicola TaxID=93591 RepID=A0ACC1NTP3_9HYPO|nr:hypothetical protein NQ176_g1473 [Lecanicillium fungicola]
MDFDDCFDDSFLDRADLSTPNILHNDSPRSVQDASPPLDAESGPESEPDQSGTTSRFPLLRSSDIDPDRDYDRNNPTCIHYDLKLKISQRGAGRKRSTQVELFNKPNIVLAPSDLWKEQLEADVAALRSDSTKFPTGSTYTCLGGAVSIKAKTTRSGLDESFNGEDVPWSTIDQHLESLGLLFRLRRMPIAVMIELTYHETSTTVAPGTRQRRSATTVARANLPSDAVFMTRFYNHHECNAKECRQNSMYCLKDRNGNHHGIDRETMRAIYLEVKQNIPEGENFEDVQDVEIPQHFRRDILSKSRKRKANGDIGCRNCKTRNTGEAEPLQIPGNPDEKLQAYFTKNLDVQNDRRRNGMEAANKFAMDELLDLATVHLKQDIVSEKMVASGVPLGCALAFVSGIASFIASQDVDEE